MRGRVLLLIVFVIAAMPGILIYSEEDVIPDEYEDIYDSIPKDIAELLPDGLFSKNAEDIADGTKMMTDWGFIVGFVLDEMGLQLKDAIKAFTVIVSILIICALLTMLQKTIKNSALENMVAVIGSLALISAIIQLCKEPISRAFELLNNLRLFVNSASPAITMLYAMGGNISSAVVHNYGLIVFLSILENVSIISLEVIVGICLSLTFAAAFVKDFNLLSLSGSIKKVFSFLLSLLMLLFTTFISAQSLLASKSDGLSSKAAKMLASQMIPLVGGAIGESLRTAGASIEYLRTNIGVILVIVLLMMILPTVISIAFYRLIFSVSNSLAGLLSCEGEGRILMELSSIFGYVLAVLCVCAVSLILLITIFAKCSSPLN